MAEAFAQRHTSREALLRAMDGHPGARGTRVLPTQPVEVDGYAAHSSPWAHERDHRKRLALRAQGLDVLAFTARQGRRRAYVVLAEIARALTSGSSAPRSPER